MIDLAFKHEKEVREKMFDTWYDEKYMFYHYSSYHEPYECHAKDGDWNSREFVSLDSNGNVLGLITYGVNRTHDYVDSLGIINFSDNKVVFGLDVAKVIDDIFCKFNMRKIEFCVVVGNPIERSYDRLVSKYGGRIVGTREKHIKLLDGKYYDDKLYELFREDYIREKERLHRK